MVNFDHHHRHSSSSAFSKAICSICHKDLDPFADDLQAIFICGHVSHEFCLQESFGFFESVKKYSCPVCKQRCGPNDVARLYFESVPASPEDPSSTPAPQSGEDSEALRREVKELKEETCHLHTSRVPVLHNSFEESSAGKLALHPVDTSCFPKFLDRNWWLNQGRWLGFGMKENLKRKKGKNMMNRGDKVLSL
ncbi:uncharacterized protein LOC126801739 [Argentina anserina]|uniref:uncharacterized protein LOC126801739 n=1 Tax=Argentina anserina TaxID=57926 RepID=UPI0021766649|nr:uncharacterized protein LOC126801739 [Potentilla anserina]